jgi:hypothetical protein
MRMPLAPFLLGGLALPAQFAQVPWALDLPMAQGLTPGNFGLRFTHRFAEPARANGKEALGFDGYAYTGLGLGWGVRGVPGLSLEVSRTSDEKTVEFAVRQQVLSGDTFRAALRAERFDATIKGGAVGSALQAPVEWEPRVGLVLSAVPTLLSRTFYHRDPLFNVGLGARWRVADSQDLTAEYIPVPRALASIRVPDTFGGTRSLQPGWAFGYSYSTFGHRFSVMATNVPGTSMNQVLGGDGGGLGPNHAGNWGLGFNVIRIF